MDPSGTRCGHSKRKLIENVGDGYPKTMNIALLLEEFCQHSLHLRGVSSQTTKRYREHISYFYQYSEITLASEITRKKVLSFFIYGRAERHWKPRTYRTYYMSLMVFFRWCVQESHMEVNHADDMELPQIEKSLPKGLNQQTAIRLLEFVYNYPYAHPYQKFRNHAIFAMFIFAGLRKSELLNLNYGDIDAENLTIFVRRGKGAKDRIIPMSSVLAQILKRYLIERKRKNRTCPTYFTSSKKDCRFTEHGLKHLTKKLKKVSGISFTIHALRHTFATLMVEGGCDIYSLSKMMGHSDIKTTTIYLSASVEHLREQIIKHPLKLLNI
jgi:site-specific recombinase XerD